LRRIHTNELVDFRRAKDLHNLIASEASSAPIIKHGNPWALQAMAGKTNQLTEDGKLLLPDFVVILVVVLSLNFMIEEVQSPHQFGE
jgi:hypothetical protein